MYGNLPGTGSTGGFASSSSGGSSAPAYTGWFDEIVGSFTNDPYEHQLMSQAYSDNYLAEANQRQMAAWTPPVSQSQRLAV